MKFLAEPGMQYAYCGTNDGVSLAFQTSLPLEDIPEVGPGSLSDPRRQTCILLMHGFSGSSKYFTRNFATLSEKHWVAAPDSKQLLDTISTPSRSKSCQMWPVPQRTYHTAGFETGYGHIVALSSPNLYTTTPLVL